MAWRNIASQNKVNIGLDNGLVVSGAMPLSASMLTYGLVTFIWGQSLKRYLIHQSIKWDWKLLVYNFIRISSESMSWLFQIGFSWLDIYHSRWLAPLAWRQNGRDGVSNHQPHDCLLNRSFRRRSKTSKLRVTCLSEGNSPVIGEFPEQRASIAENVSIWWRHHDHIVAFVN